MLYYSDDDYDDIWEEVKKHGKFWSVLRRQLDHDPVMVSVELTPVKYCSIWCFYAVDIKWQVKACCKTKLYLPKIKQSIQDEYRGDTSTHLKCPDFRSIRPRTTSTDEYSLFHAFSYVITGSEEWHKKVRKQILKHMFHIEDHLFGRYIDEHKYDDIYDYIVKTKMYKTSTLGTKVEIYTLAHLLETNIYVYFYRDRWDRSNGVWHKYGPRFVKNDMSIYITNHYEVVRKQRNL